ncbi:retrovirus-related pol polyprotein from transposon TNT 1-94 [Tanacetum coccineum]
MIPNPNNPKEQILEPLSKMSEVDACVNAKEMWERIKRLMHGSAITTNLQGILKEEKLTKPYDVIILASSKVLYNPTTNNRYGGNTKKNARRNRNQVFHVGNINDESNHIVLRVPQTDSTLSKTNVQCYNCNEKGHYARDCQKPKVRAAKYFREQMLLAMKDEAVSQVNASSKAHEQVRHVKRKTIIQTTDDDQIDSSIIFDDPFVENNGGTSDHDSNAHDEYHEIKMLTYNVQREAENKKCLNNELKKQKDLLQQELKMFKDRIKTFASKTIHV